MTDLNSILQELELRLEPFQGDDVHVHSPIDGTALAYLRNHNQQEVEEKIARSVTAFNQWRDVPAPKRGELIRLFANKLRKYKRPLAALVTLENGKILEESKGEVQEMIDICDFAVGLSRQIHGLTIPSERARHVMQENWYPLGTIGIISAFNFPVAVWAWNAALALVCGNSILWKPSEKTPLTAIACQSLLERTCQKFAARKGIAVPEGLSDFILGDAKTGNILVESHDIKLVSATGSCRMGGIVGPKVAKRFGKSLLELGGNNAVIVTPSADLNVALPSIVFGAAGTAGQRCTTTRRAFVHESIYNDVVAKLKNAYKTIGENKIGNPLEPETLIGPLIDEQSFQHMQEALERVKDEGGTVHFGKRVFGSDFPHAFYVEPALVTITEQTATVKEETFAPILYVMPYSKLEDVIAQHNAVAQGLSSAIFTTDLREAEYFKQYSDCGIANVNIGTSGAEIGGAFGGEKETGGGRESGSDAWKNYMRRQTSTTYYGTTPPALAQGVKFEV